MKIKQLCNYLNQRVIKGEPACYFITNDNKNIYLTDGYTIFIIPEEKNLVDLNKINKFEINCLLPDYNSKKLLQVENIEIDEIDKRKGNILKATCKDKVFYYRETLLKYFSKNYELYKMSSKPKSPIYVLEENQLVGLVLPIIRRAPKWVLFLCVHVNLPLKLACFFVLTRKTLIF